LREPAEAVRARRQLAARRCGVDCAWVEERIQARLQARKGKDYAKADAIRAEVAEKKVELRDTPQGTDWRVLL
jgi:cysteinyl-tRNA synthetase